MEMMKLICGGDIMAKIIDANRIKEITTKDLLKIERSLLRLKAISKVDFSQFISDNVPRETLIKIIDLFEGK